MKYLQQWLIIILMCIIGELSSKLLHIPIPGNVIGMILLFILLCTKIIRLDMIENLCNSLLDHLAFFFLPAGVGLITCFDLISGKVLSFIFVCIITMFLVITISGHTVQLIGKRRKG